MTRTRNQQATSSTRRTTTSGLVAAAHWWAPAGAMMLLSLLSYVDRNTLAILAVTIERDAGLSNEQYGWIISAFSVAYLVGNPVWGRLLDRFGVRAGLAAAAAFWSVASLSHAWAGGLASFALARAALGFGEGATFPGGLRTAVQTLRPNQRGRGLALAYSGGSLGAIATPIVVTPLALRWGWRGAFWFTGFLGAAWLALWSAVSRDVRLRPSEVRADTAAAADGPRLRDPAVWAFMMAYALGAVPLGFVLYGAPIHLGRGLGCSQATIGHVLWVPPLGWEVGYFFWGAALDRLSRRGPLTPRGYAGLFTLLAFLSLPIVGAPYATNLTVVLALLFFAMFVASGFVIVSLAETTRRHGLAHAAYLAGLGAGSWSGVMALLMPIFGRLFDHRMFAASYALAAVFPLVALAGWRVLAARSPALPAEPSPAPT